ncbi:VOC family protein [Streptomyces sp. CA-249302]|uniref:VOC family protein n=1 Tax=Streptomyces sp. CA-249302 TaxID=3240058 RepID=UPI003D91A8B6
MSPDLNQSPELDNSTDAHSIHHVNFPITDPARTEEWYGKVFGMRRIIPRGRSGSANAPQIQALLMTHGNFDLHFSPISDLDPKIHYHFAIEVEDFQAFLGHLDKLGVPYDEPYTRPQNNSSTTTIHDPDGHHVEITHHAGREW